MFCSEFGVGVNLNFLRLCSFVQLQSQRAQLEREMDNKLQETKTNVCYSSQTVLLIKCVHFFNIHVSSFTIIKWSGACMHKSSLGGISLLDGLAWPGLVLHVFTIFCTTDDTLSITFETFPNSILRFLSPFLDRSQLLPLFMHHHSVLTSTAQPFLSSIQFQCFHIYCLLYFVKSPP